MRGGYNTFDAPSEGRRNRRTRRRAKRRAAETRSYLGFRVWNSTADQSRRQPALRLCASAVCSFSASSTPWLPRLADLAADLRQDVVEAAAGGLEIVGSDDER